MMNHGFLRRGQLLDGVGNMVEHGHVVSIVQGRADYICRPEAARRLVRALEAKGASVDSEFVAGAGHSDSEPGLIDAMVRACDRFKEVLRKTLGTTTTTPTTTSLTATTMMTTKKSAIDVRPLLPSDLGQLSPAFGAYLDFYQVPRSPEAKVEFLARRLVASDSTCLGAFVINDEDCGDVEEKGRQLAGFAICYHTYNSLRLAPSWTLHDLFVMTEYRRRGIASSLIDAVHVWAVAAGACEVLLSTASNNTEAQSLYESHGYVKDDEFFVYSRDLQP